MAGLTPAQKATGVRYSIGAERRQAAADIIRSFPNFNSEALLVHMCFRERPRPVGPGRWWKSRNEEPGRLSRAANHAEIANYIAPFTNYGYSDFSKRYMIDQYSAQNTWYESYASGMKLTRAAITELLAYTRAISRVAATLRYMRKRGLDHQKRMIETWADEFRRGIKIPAVIDSYPDYHTELNSLQRARVAADTDNIFYVMFKAWAGRYDADVEHDRVDVDIREVRKALRDKMRFRWKMLEDYVVDTELTQDEREGIEQEACIAMHSTGYLPLYLTVPLGLDPFPMKRTKRGGPRGKRTGSNVLRRTGA